MADPHKNFARTLPAAEVIMNSLCREITRPRTQKELERAITHFDLQREIDYARRKRFYYDKESGLVVPVVPIGGGSFLTGTSAEVIYSNSAAGTSKGTFTTEFMINDTAAMGPPPVLPAFFFLPGAGLVSKVLRVVARGILNAATPPTWLWTFRLNPVVTPAVPPTGPIVAGGPAAVTGVNANANALWQAEFDVQLTIAGAPGNNSTLRGLGNVESPLGLVSPFMQSLFGGAASPGTVATFDLSLLNTLTVGVTCGTSASGNNVQLLQLLMLGLN